MAISYHEALQRMETSLHPLHVSESLPLLSAINRIAKNPVYASFELPKCAISLKEGYGICLNSSLLLPLEKSFKVSTGGILPPTINAVIPEEEAYCEANTLRISASIQPFWNIKRQGEDVAQGECLIHPYEYLHPYKITALAAQGITHIDVVQKPKISILSIGDHLTSLGSPLEQTHVYNSNAMSIGARALALGAHIQDIQTCKEEQQTILNTLEHLSHTSDVIITTGAMSKNDAMSHLLEHHALNVLFHGSDICPARPTALSFIGRVPILHLPGLPLSAMLGFELLGVPLLRALQHQYPLLPPSIRCINQTLITCKHDCVNAIPGFSDGVYFRSAPHYEAGRLNILSQCNGYIRVENQATLNINEPVSFIPFTYHQPPVS